MNQDSRTMELDGFQVRIERGNDDRAMLVFIDTSIAYEAGHDHEDTLPRLHVYVNDATVHDFTAERPTAAPPQPTRKDNVTVVTELMDFSRNGPLMHAFVFTALQRYAELCIKTGAPKLDQPMVSGEAWLACAREALATADRHLALENAEMPWCDRCRAYHHTSAPHIHTPQENKA